MGGSGEFSSTPITNRDRLINCLVLRTLPAAMAVPKMWKSLECSAC